MCVPTKTFLTYNNNKPWFSPKLRQLRQAKEEAYRSGDRILYNQTRNTLTKKIRVRSKRSYTEKLKNNFSLDPNVKLLKFADDTTVISLIRDGDESAYRQEVEQLAFCCGQNNLELNMLKTVEMTVDCQPPNTAPPFHSEQHGVCCGNFPGFHNLPGPEPPNRTGTDYNGQSELQKKIISASPPSIQDLNVSSVRKRA
ncbi:hypothetical protein L3Q82_022715, partial [Scortum barcoo]